MADDAAPEETSVLIEHILARYHEVHRRELAALLALAQRVEAEHAAHPQVPRGLVAILRWMRGELELHMMREEQVLFPAMLRRSGAYLDAPITQMRYEHDVHDDQLRRLEELTHGFTVPEDGDAAWRTLYDGLAKLVEDLREHIRLENEVLFPRFEEEHVA